MPFASCLPASTPASLLYTEVLVSQHAIDRATGRSPFFEPTFHCHSQISAVACCLTPRSANHVLSKSLKVTSAQVRGCSCPLLLAADCVTHLSAKSNFCRGTVSPKEFLLFQGNMLHWLFNMRQAVLSCFATPSHIDTGRDMYPLWILQPLRRRFN